MPSHPLTHHEIFALVAPFVARGWRADLAATDRMARRLVLRPAPPRTEDGPSGEAAADAGEAHTPRVAAPPGATLILENPRKDKYRLTRIAAGPDGLEARLETEGPDVAALLHRIEQVPPDRQFCARDTFSIAWSHRLQEDESTSAPSAAGERAEAGLRLALVRAVALVDGVTLTVKMPPVRGYPADVEITTAEDDGFLPPDDLLAVLGRDWRRLGQVGRAKRWSSALRIRGREPEASRNAEAAIETAAIHLARTLSEPPAAFHQRLYRERWRVTLRRATPLAVSIVLLVASLGVSKLDLAPGNPLWLLLFNAPPLLLAGFFCMREIPRIEIPPLPRVSRAAAWRTPSPLSSPALAPSETPESDYRPT
ncbi:hypothetical protein A33M_2748 [Rhodovulum sp. PH10]|uniref:hypothetical protein n=1 Tax=Rhodovulum sp. PH10 TaxID=1187851 RepID=UPI00027C266B|nr:hypothetical protein [Rhodovulum sp. PH10]EJW11765.1 hypothetical protein A33M_2748 [Rhodovulum sp. PH10]